MRTAVFHPPHASYPYVPVGTGQLKGLKAAGFISPPAGFIRLGQTELDAGYTLPPAWIWAWRLASVAGAGLGAYHGYKRHDSAGYAVLWFLYGGILPVLALPVAFAQGFAKRKRGR